MVQHADIGSPRPSPRPASQLRDGFAVQARIIGALVVRDMMRRYGRSNLGFLWVVLEPMLLTAGVMALWSAIKSPYDHGVAVITIVLTGYMPLTLYRHVTGLGVHALSQSMPFLYHRHISLFDVILARVFLEFIATSGALLVVYFVLLAFGLVDAIYDPGLALLGWSLMGLLSFGLCVLFAVLTEIFESAEKFVQPFQYLQMPMSGCFFMVDWVPKKAQTLLWYNPTVHCYEMFRAGYYGPSVATHYTVWYPLLAGFLMVAIGLSLFNTARDHLHTG